METIYFTLSAVALYFVSDWILIKIETRRGQPFTDRTLIFFAIIATLAMGVFALLRYVLQD
jgi:hypothetical protein